MRQFLSAAAVASLVVASSCSQGSPGPQGERGLTGAVGPAGVAGAAGAAGDAGPKGDPGLPGTTTFSITVADGGSFVVDAGVIVVVGPVGPQGPAGDPGMAGHDGASPAVAIVPQANFNCANGGVSIRPTDGGATLFVCNGAQGSQGVQGNTGAQGGGLYITKNLTYCNAVNVTSGGGAADASALCNDANDLPLAGGCETTDFAAKLYSSSTENWAVQTSISRWNCSWSGTTAAAIVTARICCLTVAN